MTDTPEGNQNPVSQKQRWSSPTEFAKLFAEMIGIGAFLVAVAMCTCCFQVRSSDGTVHMYGNCDAAQLEDTCRGLLDPSHQTRVEKMYQEDSNKDPDKLYLHMQVGEKPR